MKQLTILLLVSAMIILPAAGSPPGREREGRGWSNKCLLDPGVVGLCEALLERWTYRQDEGCVTFQYGGCGGNWNNFATEWECREACYP